MSDQQLVTAAEAIAALGFDQDECRLLLAGPFAPVEGYLTVVCRHYWPATPLPAHPPISRCRRGNLEEELAVLAAPGVTSLERASRASAHRYARWLFLPPAFRGRRRRVGIVVVQRPRRPAQLRLLAAGRGDDRRLLGCRLAGIVGRRWRSDGRLGLQLPGVPGDDRRAGPAAPPASPWAAACSGRCW